MKEKGRTIWNKKHDYVTGEKTLRYSFMFFVNRLWNDLSRGGLPLMLDCTMKSRKLLFILGIHHIGRVNKVYNGTPQKQERISHGQIW